MIYEIIVDIKELLFKSGFIFYADPVNMDRPPKNNQP